MTNLERTMESDRLKHAISSVETYMSYPNGKLRQTAKIAIEAIEKQIPKKIIERTDSYSYCPKCGAILSANFYKARYCHNCGQAMDWSEEIKDGLYY